MKKEENILCYDFQGWPVYKMTLREMLEKLGFTKISNRSVDYWQIADNDPILDTYPQTLEDDGMGYGVNPHFFTDISHPTADEVYMFIESFSEKNLEDKE